MYDSIAEALRDAHRAPGWTAIERPIGAGVGTRVLAVLASRRVAMSLLAVLAGVLYLTNLTVSGYANTYYALAAQAGSQSWSALFFGALDAQGFITIDKPPLATWLMALSVRAFGLSSWSILLPEALLGIATVLVLYLAVRRSFGPAAALLAGVLMAVTPVAVLMFRYDNPDALLTFLLVAAAWALGRGLEAGRIRWALLAAAFVGTAFLTKYLQAYLLLPVFALVWLVSAPGTLRRRLTGLVASAAVVLATSGWWVAIIELLPASARPFIGGSTNNSVLDLIFGYDGLGRIFGSTAGSGLASAVDGLAFGGGAGRGGPSFGGDPGLLRLFNDQFGGHIAWLLPAAIVGLGVVLLARRRATRTDRRLAGALLWGGWLLVHVLVFSFMSGIVHPYYAVAMAPAIAALVAAGVMELWSRRGSSVLARVALAASVLGTGALAWFLLDQTPDFAPGLGIAVHALATAAALVLLAPPPLVDRRIVPIGATFALIAVLAGPMAYSVETMASALSGGDPAAGPNAAGAFDGIGGTGGPPGFAAATADESLVTYLLASQGQARWIVAVSGSQSSAAIQLAAGQPVMTMGGFTGSDPAPTLDQLRAYVASGELRYVLLNGNLGGGPGGFGGPGGGPPGAAEAGSISQWVAASCTAITVDGSSGGNLYDCAAAA
jgi:4-amino-4-deoxy-L-arabinose transferase-like glycosyltransferase